MNAAWNEELGRRQKVAAHKAEEQKKKKRMAAMTLEGFRKQLLLRYGSIVTAWRCALDLDGNGRLSFGEFCMALRDLSYNGNVKQLWAELHSDGSGLIALRDLDPVAADGLETFR